MKARLHVEDLKKLNDNIENAVQQYQDLIDEKPGASEPDMSLLRNPTPRTTTPRTTPTVNHNLNTTSALSTKPEPSKDAFADFGSFGNDNGFASFGSSNSAAVNVSSDPFGGSSVAASASADPFGNSDPFASTTAPSSSAFDDVGFGKEDPFAKEDLFKSADPFAGSDPFKSSTAGADSDPFAGSDPFSSNTGTSAANDWTTSGLDALSRPKVSVVVVQDIILL